MEEVMASQTRTILAKEPFYHFVDVGERLESSSGQDAMDQAGVLFTFAVSF
jgi:hypothetical protein